MSEITVNGLKDLCEKVLEIRHRAEAAEEILSAINKEKLDAEQELIQTMTELNMKDFRDEKGLFLIRKTSSVTTPKGDNKEIFFDYLKEIGHFDALATVHSKTLNSWYNQEKEAAILRGEPIFSVPGLEMPVERLGLTIRPAK